MTEMNRVRTFAFEHVREFRVVIALAVFGRVADSVTTILGLSLLENVYESTAFTAWLIGEFGLIPATTLIGIPIYIVPLIGLMMVAHWLLSNAGDELPYSEQAGWGMVVVGYAFAAAYSMSLAVSNLALFF